MLFEINGHKCKGSSPLAIIICKVIHYCDLFNLPLKIEAAEYDKMTIDISEWGDVLTQKFCWQMNRDYSDLSKMKVELCTLYGDKLKIVVNPNKDINKFE